MEDYPNDTDSDSESDDELIEHLEKRRRVDAAAASLVHALVAMQQSGSSTEEVDAQKTTISTRKKRGKSALPTVCRDEDGNIVPVQPNLSTWYLTYVAEPNIHETRWLAKFRRRFRIPYAGFQELVRMARMGVNAEYFGRWVNYKGDKVGRHPIELLILGSLRYIGRGFTFDDLNESTGISEEVHRVFFHQFAKFGHNVLYPQYVKIPDTAVKARSNAYEEAGFPGCIGSMDATHVLCEKVPHDLHQIHKAFKLPGTARTYNIVVTNGRKVLSSTKGHPARYNDKTLVRYDELATRLRYGSDEVLDNFVFVLYEDRDNAVVPVKYKGAWIIVDNGYLRWSCTIAPYKTTTSYQQLRFSRWLESLRKDVECTFGIMKARNRVIKAGIRLHGVEACDSIWLTCCALHNLCLELDGHEDERYWTVDKGDFTAEEVDLMPLALQRLHNPGELRTFDSSGMGRGTDNDPYVEDDDGAGGGVDMDEDNNDTRPLDDVLMDATDAEGFRRVRLLPHDFFRERLVEHFDIMFTQRKIKWPGNLREPSIGLT